MKPPRRPAGRPVTSSCRGRVAAPPGGTAGGGRARAPGGEFPDDDLAERDLRKEGREGRRDGLALSGENKYVGEGRCRRLGLGNRVRALDNEIS